MVRAINEYLCTTICHFRYMYSREYTLYTLNMVPFESVTEAMKYKRILKLAYNICTHVKKNLKSWNIL